jgi:predicted O-methyltransferase YrrM
MEYPEIINTITQTIHTNVTRSELLTLHNLAKSASVAVEIGSYLGASSVAIASGLPENGKLYCIDIWKSNPAMRPDPKSGRSLFEEFLFNVDEYIDKIKALARYSYDVIDYFLENEIKTDLLFIDGDHTAEGVKTDWDLYSGIMQPGGIVVLHDYGWNSVKNVIHTHVIHRLKWHKRLPNMFWGEIK